MTGLDTPHGNRIVELGVLELSRRIRSGKLSCEETMVAYLMHIDRINPSVNAIVSRRSHEELLGEARSADQELARGHLRGPLHGVPQAPKDLAAMRDLPTTLGSPLFAGRTLGADAVFVERMRRAGAIFVGRTNVPALGLGSHTFNDLHGTTCNPWDLGRSAGGSSGGAAAAVAARMLPVADGSDMMGSLRNPGAWNNLFGLRPTQGMVPFGPTPEMFLQQFVTDGVLARSVPDLLMLLQLMAGRDARVPLSTGLGADGLADALSVPLTGCSLAWLGNLDGELAVEPRLLAAMDAALSHVPATGLQIRATALGFPVAQLWEAWTTLRSFLVAHQYGHLYDDPASFQQLSLEARWEIELGRSLQPARIHAASCIRTRWYAHLLAMFERFDFLVLPGTQVLPFDAGERWPNSVAARPMDTYHRWMEVMIFASLAGAPALSVPAGFVAGLPFGLQVIARPGDDARLLRVGHALDLVIGAAGQAPPVLMDLPLSR